MSNPAKMLRSQLRNVVQEILPEMMVSEAFKDLHSALQKRMIQELDGIKVEIRKTLEAIDERSKNVQSFIMNQVQADMARNAAPVVAEEKSE